MELLLKHSFSKDCIMHSLKAAFVVGTLLALINHYDSIIAGTLTTTNIFQIILTYFIPYGVSTFGFTMCKIGQVDINELNKIEDKLKTQ